MAIRALRPKVFLATKFGIVRDKANPAARVVHGRPEHVRASCDASLKRLGVETIDSKILPRTTPINLLLRCAASALCFNNLLSPGYNCLPWNSVESSMNRYETWFCGTPVWRWVTRRQLLPWILQGSELGEHVLELGAGPGAGTEELARLAPRVTSLEYDHVFAAKLGARVNGSNGAVIQGDAAALPFAERTFSSAVAILMLHHLRSSEQQDCAFAEIQRVLQPGGVFLAFEIQDGWMHRIAHIRSTFVPVAPASAFARLTTAGFSKVMVDIRRGGFRIRALHAREC
jgi:SAM-dependent methyltransferase